MDNYRNYFTITSQLYFCSSPIRLDTYNQCQFGCVYCFSRNRMGDHTSKAVKTASHSAFEKRLCRVFQGNINSGLDEFIARRVPIQLGGLHDPFTAQEFTSQTTLNILRILRDFQYPTLISTKGRLFMAPEYSDVLKAMNVHIRLSAAGISEINRKRIDIGCDPFDETCNKIKFIKNLGLSTSLRIQPVIPGFEKDALRMTQQAAACGVSHVSYEYLKVAAESKERELKRLATETRVDIWKIMTTLGITKIGRDYTLKREAKLQFLNSAKKLCIELGIRFGAGDTEFIHLSDGAGCCNSSEFFLNNSNQFRANFVGVLSSKKSNAKIRFDDLYREWIPEMNIHRYLTTNSRSRDLRKGLSSLLSLLAYRWNGEKGPYSPTFFHGVDWKGDYDNEGFKIYEFNSPW